MAKNSILTLEPGVFDGVDMTLKRLDLSENALVSMDNNVFEKLTELVFINLADNALQSIGDKVFSYMYKLRYLQLNGNSLTTLGATTVLDPLSMLQVLRLD